jgi:hypothetical protein
MSGRKKWAYWTPKQSALGAGARERLRRKKSQKPSTPVTHVVRDDRWLRSYEWPRSSSASQRAGQETRNQKVQTHRGGSELKRYRARQEGQLPKPMKIGEQKQRSPRMVTHDAVDIRDFNYLHLANLTFPRTGLLYRFVGFTITSKPVRFLVF